MRREAPNAPTNNYPHKYHPYKENYYLYFKDIKRYLLVSVKYLNNEGDVRTAFITRKIIKK